MYHSYYHNLFYNSTSISHQKLEREYSKIIDRETEILEMKHNLSLNEQKLSQIERLQEIRADEVSLEIQAIISSAPI